ncbi:hypothetical protein [Polaromonas sp. UC242_47]|uniref:hypothetical protein n=1 Tax=Polaromonas sp. UC242_47 TaxID=3374626 RepID=UPI00379E65EE
MKNMRLSALLAITGLAATLSGCVVAPIGPGPVAVYPAGAYVAPVVVPSVQLNYGYYGYRGYYGRRHWH